MSGRAIDQQDYRTCLGRHMMEGPRKEVFNPNELA